MFGKHLVTGGAGMIGSHLCRRLLADGYQVHCVDNLLSGSIKNISDLLNYPGFQFKEVDLRQADLCQKVVQGCDYIWSLAANMGGVNFISTVGADILRDNTLININMLEASRKANTKGYFFGSSACVYPSYRQGSADVEPLKEDDAYPADPDQFYGWEKLVAEKACEAFARDYGLSVRIARFHNVMGEAYTAFDRIRGKAPCHLILKAIRHPNPPFIIWGDGLASRSFLYIEDCIDGMLRLMVSNFNRPINIGSDRLVTVNELAKIIIGISRKGIVPQHDLTKPQGVRGRNADIRLARITLGWEPKVSLEEGLTRIYRWAVGHFGELEGI